MSFDLCISFSWNDILTLPVLSQPNLFIRKTLRNYLCWDSFSTSFLYTWGFCSWFCSRLWHITLRRFLCWLCRRLSASSGSFVSSETVSFLFYIFIFPRSSKFWVCRIIISILRNESIWSKVQAAFMVRQYDCIKIVSFHFLISHNFTQLFIFL